MKYELAYRSKAPDEYTGDYIYGYAVADVHTLDLNAAHIKLRFSLLKKGYELLRVLPYYTQETYKENEAEFHEYVCRKLGYDPIG